MTTFGGLYLATVSRLASLARSLTAAELARPVPACPAWDAHDLLAHVAGGAADHSNSRLDGFPGGGWSARHVAERREHTGAELAAELEHHAPAVAARCDANPHGPNSAWDALVHEQDLAEALDASSRRLAPGWELVLDAGSRVLAATRDVHVVTTVRPDDAPWPVELRVADLHARADVDPYELIRAMFSRRTAAQLTGWGWRTDDPAALAEVVGGLAFFGPARASPPGP